MTVTLVSLLLLPLCHSTEVHNTTEIAPGVFMPQVSFGGYATKPTNFSIALDLGARGFDTALLYGTDLQAQVGEVVRSGKVAREELFITTKIPCCPAPKILTNGTDFCAMFGGLSVKNVEWQLNKSLELIGIDHVDLMLLHCPCTEVADTIATYKEMEAFMTKYPGKIKQIGVSNFNKTELEALLPTVTRRPVVNQCGFSIGNHNFPVLGMDDDTRIYSNQQNITYQAYSPLGGWTGANVLGDPTVNKIAKSHGVSAAQVALRFVGQQPALYVTAADKQAYMQEDLDIFNFNLTDAEMQELEAVH
eukprot:m.3697 g.3697  ORF g.3697 m.3697 type:complete len:305 (+) comp2812_c0_seq1:184-1098(+)